MANPFQDLFSQNAVQTPDGRYFLPFSKTYLGQQQMQQDVDESGTPFGEKYYRGAWDDNSGLNRYSSLNDYFNATDPGSAGVLGPGAQNGIGINTQGMSAEQIAGLRGNYNGELGYYVDPNTIAGTHPATTGGMKPNEGGLWQMLSLLLPAAGELTGLASTAGAGASSASASDATAGTGAFGGSVPAAAGSGAAIGGSAGSATLTGGAGEDAATTATASSTGGNMGYFDDQSGQWIDTSDQYTSQGIGQAGPEDPYTYQGIGNAGPSQGTDSLWDTLKQYYGDAKTALSAYRTITGGSGSAGGSVLGAGLGGLLGGLGGGSKPAGTTTTIQDIPDWQKALLMPALSQSYGLLQQQKGQSYPLLNSAQDTLGKTISGGFLNSNPYLDATYNEAAKSVTDNYNSVVRPQNDAMFYKAGAFGPSNSAYDETVARNQFGLGQNLQNLATNIYGGNFAQERQNQLNASINAPAFSQAASATQWSPYQNFLSVAGGNFGGSQQSPYFQNKTGNIFGGALLGSQLFK